jgi:hypothetical protein
MEPRSGARRKLKPRRIVNYITSRWPAIDAYHRDSERAFTSQTTNGAVNIS